MTESTEIIKVEMFNEIPVRVIEREEKVIPLVDIAHGTGYDPYELVRLHKRNLELLEEDTQTVMMTTGNQVAPIPHVCLTRDGIIGIMNKMDVLRIKDPVKKARILSFQRWAKKVLAHAIAEQNGDLVANQDKDPWSGKPNVKKVEWGKNPKEHIELAMIIADALNVPKGLAMATALSVAGNEAGIDLSGYMKLLPPAEGDVDYLTATELGRILGRTAKEVHYYLTRNGVIFQAEGKWLLTEKGRAWGANFPFSRNGHSDYYLKYKRSILTDLKMVENNPTRIRET